MNEVSAPKTEEAISEIRQLRKIDEVDSFDSGRQSSNEFLKKFGISSQADGSAKIFVICRGKKVIGYYSLSAGSVEAKIASIRAAKGMPKNGKVPVILLGQLAVDKEEQGKNVGSALLKDAILRTLKSSENVGVRAMLVHAIDDAARQFYLKYDFEDCPAHDLSLMLLLKDAKKVFE